ncbi:MAG: flagellar filament capping protein FliD [Candidatus Tectomicrobia bacterium]|uniref:Flagellar hook-associated protein 2 n=1 Tax=Tectimicrobiota bacterium TaxID=2528274 RepID=A0A932MND2_UNCTE|nr:flagellar filament capping protein FliD [Candidatus Tectomicrobia bacterium]
MAGPVSVDGLISGLDTKSIIEQLVALQASRVAKLQAKQADQTEKVALFQTLQANYLSVRTAAASLKSPSLFDQRSVSSSDTDILTATASATAAVGSHQLVVKQLAKKNQYVSNRFSDTNATTLGSGTLTITVGTGASAVSTAITIDNSNNTLDGIAAAINGSGAKVTASIIKVDSSSAPYQLTVTAKEGGAGNAVTITQTAGIKTSVTGEVLGKGAAASTQDTDDLNAKTYALRHIPNANTTTVKVNGVAQAEGIAATLTAQDTGGTLLASTQYHYVVAAVVGGVETVVSGISSVTTPTGANDNSVQVQFGDVQNATEYRIYRISDAQAGTPGSPVLADFTGQNSRIGTVSDNGSATFTFTDTNQAQTAALTTTTTGAYTLDETTGAVAFFADQTLTVTADYEYDLEFKQSQAAQDAIIEFGAGANAVTIRKSSNEISDVIEGVTLSLKKEDAAATIIVEVKRSTLGVTGSVQSLLDAINDTEAFIQENSFFDAETNATGPLFSDFNLFTTRSRVSEILTGVVKSIAPGKIRALSEAGISLSPDTGRYTLDTAKFSSLLASKPDELRDLFASVATATDTDIQALAFSAKTKTSSSLGYAVQITQAATRAEDVGAQNVSGGLTQNETLTITAGGLTASASLTSGMTAQDAVTAINTTLKNAGITDVSASFNSSTGKITLIHAKYGLKHSFKVKSTVASGTAGSSGLGSTVANTEATFTGQDVKGTIGGEAATGEGQTLTGDSGNTSTDGLQILVKITPAQLTAQGASQGVVTVSRGIATQLDELLGFLTDQNQDGPIQAAIDEANSRVSDLKSQIDAVNARIAREQARLSEEFTRLEQALGTLQTTSQFLSRQLAQINANASNFGKR